MKFYWEGDQLYTKHVPADDNKDKWRTTFCLGMKEAREPVEVNIKKLYICRQYILSLYYRCI